MTTFGFDQPLYVLPFDHRGSFQKKMFGWDGELSVEQTAEIAAAKRVIYDAFRGAIAAGVPKDKAGILVDEQFGAALLRDASAQGYSPLAPRRRAVRTSSTSNTAKISPNTLKPFTPPSAKFWFATTLRGI